MKSVFIEQLDVLVLRGNKLFGDPGSYGESLLPPWPSVASGAIRSAILAQDGDPFAFAKGDWKHPTLGTPSEPGPFTITAFHLARRQGDRVEPLFQPPADLVIERDGDAVAVRRVRPTVRARELASSNPLSSLPVLAQKNRTKPLSGYWLTAAGWRANLGDQAIELDHLVASGALWRYDLRVGVGLSSTTGHVEEGKLFSVNTVAFKPEVGFLACVAHLDLAGDSLLRFGGDGRGARMQIVEVDWPQPDIEAIARAKQGRMVLTTPGLFERGWLPTGVSAVDGTHRFDLHGVHARLAAAAVPRAEVVSGFDLANSLPKPALRAAPAGSVYWLDEIDATPEALGNLAQAGLWPTELHNDARRAEGFNRMILAAY